MMETLETIRAIFMTIAVLFWAALGIVTVVYFIRTTGRALAPKRVESVLFNAGALAAAVAIVAAIIKITLT